MMKFAPRRAVRVIHEGGQKPKDVELFTKHTQATNLRPGEWRVSWCPWWIKSELQLSAQSGKIHSGKCRNISFSKTQNRL